MDGIGSCVSDLETFTCEVGKALETNWGALLVSVLDSAARRINLIKTFGGAKLPSVSPFFFAPPRPSLRGMLPHVRLIAGLVSSESRRARALADSLCPQCLAGTQRSGGYPTGSLHPRLRSRGRGRPGAPKSFLFTVVRNIMADRIRRRRVVSIEMKDDLDALNVLIDENSPEHCVGVREEFLKLAAAFEALPIECRDVVWLRKVERLTQKDVSRRLGVPQRTIEKRVARGIRILAKAVFGEAADYKIQAKVSPDRTEREHG